MVTAKTAENQEHLEKSTKFGKLKKSCKKMVWGVKSLRRCEPGAHRDRNPWPIPGRITSGGASREEDRPGRRPEMRPPGPEALRRGGARMAPGGLAWASGDEGDGDDHGDGGDDGDDEDDDPRLRHNRWYNARTQLPLQPRPRPEAPTPTPPTLIYF